MGLMMSMFYGEISKEELETALNKAKGIVSSNPVVVFSKTHCGYSQRVKQLLTQLGATYKLLELGEENDGIKIQAALVEWTGQRTVPNVFIAGKHIGGCDGGAASGLTVGITLLGVASLLLLFLLLFLSVGITLGKLLQYKEVHQEGQIFHWYQDIIRVTLGPGKRGQWTWKKQPNSVYLIMLGPLFEDLRGPPKYMLTQISGGNPHKQGDRIIASEDETEDAEAPFIQKLFGIHRIYYTLLESVKRFCLGIVAGAYMNDWSTKTPAIILLSITSFQLFFLVLKKPFIKKRVQLVVIISVACEVGMFASCFVLLEKEFSAGAESKIGIFMVILFLAAFFALMTNEWYALYRQTKKLDPDEKSFLTGLKIVSYGFLLTVLPQNLTKNIRSKFPLNRSGGGETLETSSSAGRNGSSGSRSSGTTDKPWLKQLRELAKSSFSREGSGTPNDPSSSWTNWSGFWNRNRSGSSSSDSKSKPNRLYKDLEAIFAAK
ncbi:hypothetical protein LWI29_028925 [Acer saccharum]|uniref:Glutaredoxin domain-containing protein n=1 Tax=Acer saccharum TaxID=4024 RepID=A0AA39S8N8_ACESA|nr:hypothetical protein LWI29_028925 [Acer saccharum]